MKIIKVLSKKLGNKEYIKYLINVPKKVIEDSGLLNKKLKATVEKGKIIIEGEK